MATLGSSSWMSYAPQGVKGTDDDDVKTGAVPLSTYHVACLRTAK
jgi:hypothetical protein